MSEDNTETYLQAIAVHRCLRMPISPDEVADLYSEYVYIWDLLGEVVEDRAHLRTERDQARRELEELRQRRCETCRWGNAQMERCDLATSKRDRPINPNAPMYATGHATGYSLLIVRGDFYCAAHAARRAEEAGDV